jgi:alkylhydroperoxidase family enzyme
MRIPMLDVEQLDAELAEMLARWQAEEGDPNFIRTFGRLPETLKRFVRFYSPLVRKGLIEHRTKELVRLRLAQQNQCHY